MNIFKTIVTICAVAFLYVTVSAQDFYDEFRAKSIDVEGVKIDQKMTYDQFVAKFGIPDSFRGRRRFWKRLRDVPLMQQMYCWMKVENHAVTITWFRENGILMKSHGIRDKLFWVCWMLMKLPNHLKHLQRHVKPVIGGLDWKSRIIRH